MQGSREPSRLLSGSFLRAVSVPKSPYHGSRHPGPWANLATDLESDHFGPGKTDEKGENSRNGEWRESCPNAKRQSIPFDNNTAERGIRPAVLIRKNRYGNRSQCGADCHAVLMSIFRTLKPRGHDPIRTVVHAIARYLTTGQLPPLPEAKTTSVG